MSKETSVESNKTDKQICIENWVLTLDIQMLCSVLQKQKLDYEEGDEGNKRKSMQQGQVIGLCNVSRHWYMYKEYT